METNNISRRNFIRLSGMTGTVLALGYYMPSFGKEGEVLSTSEAESAGIELNAWISIDTSGKITLTNHRAEMGQGSYQSVPQIIAEELEVSMDQINIVSAIGNPMRYGSQGTGGSSTIREAYKGLLKLGASAREMLIEAAAKKWGVNASECYADKGQVIHRNSGKKAGYGELVEAASKLTPPKFIPLKNIKDYKIVRKPLPRKDTPLKTNGEAVFGIDKKLPGMMYAVVERSPRFIGKVKSIN
ncbi:MAG TPA: molybdopterin-dependent oxidoreductase, partial [Cyclobacteriaceae bacterium]|nr:molybdopterin-dependent oxidoreductase [Cyclobacteriaceae bacterium]